MLNMDTPGDTQPATQRHIKPSAYDTFKDGLRQIMSVPKAEIDKRETEYQEQQQQKKNSKKAG